MSAGSSSTTNIAGKIRKMSGKSIFTGAFCASSSAFALRFLRISSARLRRIWPIETPSVSPWMIAADERLDAGRRRCASARLSSASVGREAHALLLERQPELLGERPVELRCAASRSEPMNPMPASTVTTRRSISSGSSLSIVVMALLRAPVEQDRGEVPAEQGRDEDRRIRRCARVTPATTPSSRKRNVTAIAPISW